MTDEKEKAKRKIKKKALAKFVDNGATVTCWFDMERGDLCFRMRRRRITRASLRDVWDKVNGQQILPLT